MARADFSNSTDGFPLVEEGVQNTTIEKCYENKSKGGNNQVVFELRTSSGGRLWHYCVNEPDKNCWMFRKTIHAITGQKPEKGPFSFEPDDYVGESLKVEVFHDEFNGRISAKVKDVILSGDEGVPGSDKLSEENDLPF